MPPAQAPLRAYIAIGSNLGDSTHTIRAACQRLQLLSDFPIICSRIIRTAPVDCPPGSPQFSNAVVALQPKLGETPETLLEHLQQIETDLGRRRSGVQNEPRTLDLDLIAFGTETRNTAALTLPHPRAHLRRFVLQPMAEIDARFILPGQHRSVQELLEHLPADAV